MFFFLQKSWYLIVLSCQKIFNTFNFAQIVTTIETLIT